MILVTGGAGFIGSNLLWRLEQEGIGPLLVCDQMGQDERWRNLSRRNIWEIIHPQSLFSILEKHAIKAVFHLGAISSTTETDVDLIVRTNIHLSQDLWRWCASKKIPFIYASSAATYGDGSQGFDDDTDQLNELSPLNAYGWSKHFFDRWALQQASPPQWAGLKFFNVYGPHEYHKGGQRSVVTTLYPQLKDTGKARLFKSYQEGYSDGGQMRDFVYVDDCVDVMMWLYHHPSVSGLFNVGTGIARTFEDLAKSLFSALNKTAHIDYIDMPLTLRESYQYFTQASLLNLRRAGYAMPFTSLEEGVKVYVQQFLESGRLYR